MPPQPRVRRGFMWQVSFIAGLGGILYGFDMGVIAAALVYVRKSFELSTIMQELVVSVVLVGSMGGALGGGAIADRIGRRATLLWGAVLFLAGSVLAFAAPGVVLLIVARALLGIAIGFTSVTAPVYVSELAPPQSRGMLIGLYQFALTVGIALADLVGYWLASQHGWRMMFGIGAIPAAVFLVCVLTLPESPRWLLARNRDREAEAVLSTYTDGPGAQVLLADIRAGLQVKMEQRWSALWSPAVRMSLLIAVGFTVLQQATGINTIIYYGPKIFTLAGIASSEDAILATLLVAVTNVLATIIALVLVDRESEVRFLPESKTRTPLRKADRADYIAQMRRGIPLGDGAYLRRFPVWFDFRGNSSVLLSEAKALSVASQLRGDVAGEDLAQKQAQWIVGRNPFSSSIMYGEGYDWNPLYSVRSGQMVGAIPVGIETRGSADTPYWPTQICWTYKEVWTQPVGEWIWLMDDLSGPAVVEGVADSASRSPVQLVDEKTGRVRTAAWEKTAGHFRVVAPQGHYTIRQGAEHTSLLALSAGSYRVDLRKGNAVNMTAQVRTAGPQDVVVQLEAEGSGTHRFTLRADNLSLREPAEQEVRLERGRKEAVTWHARITNVRTPWVGVVVQDGDMEKRTEVTGVATEH